MPIEPDGTSRRPPLHHPTRLAFPARRSSARGSGASVGSLARLLSCLLPCLLFANASLATGTSLDSLDPDAVEAFRQGEAVVLMRHALAPGTGDPTNFERGDCTTQRNLSDAGRAQARAIGERLRTLLGERTAEVYSSAWCRCLDTARLLDVGAVEPLPALDSFFGERDRRDARTESLATWIASRLAADPARPPAVLVTHQVNVTALTGEFVASGEALIVTETDGRARVLATIGTDPPTASGQ